MKCSMFRGQQRGELDDKFDPTQCAEVFTSVFIFTTVNWLTGWWTKEVTLTQRVRSATIILLSGMSIPRSTL